MDIYGIIMKNSKMLEFVPDHLKTKNLRKHAVKNYLICYNIFLINIKLNKCVIKLH